MELVMHESHNKERSKINILTPKDIVDIVKKAKNDSSITIIDYQLSNQSNHKLGMTGYHLKLDIKVQKHSNLEILHFFVKGMPLNNAEHAEIVKSQALYEKEMYFFDTIVPLFKLDLQIKKYLPECFFVKEGVLVLENLVCQGYQTSRTFFDEYKMLESAFATLARFHSVSLITEARLNLESEIPMTLKERYPDAFEEKVFSQTGPMKVWFNNNVTLIGNIMEHYGKTSGKIRQQFDKIYELIKPSKRHRNVICHSDVHGNNLMFDEFEPTPNCVLVDFQTIRYGPLVLDLLQLLHLNASRSFRTTHEKKLIKYYSSIMADTISKCNDLLGKVVIPTEEEILSGLKDLRIYGSIVACMYKPLTMLDPKVMCDLTNDGKNFGALLYSDRTKLTLNQMEEDESYKIQILESISELMNNQ